MNETLYNDMSKVYLESIAPADPRPQILKERILEAKKRLDPVGQEDDDVDNDGDSDKKDLYLLRRRNAISNAIGSSKIKEEFLYEPTERYNWRSTVGEDIQGAIDGLKADKQIEVKPVDNYSKGRNGKRVVTINPTITDLKEQVDEMGGELISEMDINELSVIAAEYFIECGLNEDGVRIVIEELGDEEFCDWVLDIADETVLMEERAAKRKTPAATRAKKEIDRKAAVKTATVNQKTKSRPPGQERMIRGTQQAPKKATSPETTKAATRSVADALARTALSAWEGHKSAMQAKKEGKSLGKQLASGAGASLGSFFKKGTSQFKEYVEYLMSEGYDLSEITLQDLYEVTGMGGFVDPATGYYDPKVKSYTQKKRSLKNPKFIRSTLYSDNTPLKSEPTKLSRRSLNQKKPSGMTQTPTEKAFTAANKATIQGDSKRANKIRTKIYNFMNYEEFNIWIDNLMSEGYDLSEITLQDFYEQFEQLQEKASSEQQQKLFGLALSVKRGDTPRSEASEEVLKIVDSMSEKKIRDFAKTKHENIPRKVEEGVTYETIINILKR